MNSVIQAQATIDGMIALHKGNYAGFRNYDGFEGIGASLGLASGIGIFSATVAANHFLSKK